jgi:hypothetical protein
VCVQSTENQLVIDSNADKFIEGRVVSNVFSHTLKLNAKPGMSSADSKTVAAMPYDGIRRPDENTFNRQARATVTAALSKSNGACLIWVKAGHEVRQERKKAMMDLLDILAYPAPVADEGPSDDDASEQIAHEAREPPPRREDARPPGRLAPSDELIHHSTRLSAGNPPELPVSITRMRFDHHHHNNSSPTPGLVDHEATAEDDGAAAADESDPQSIAESQSLLADEYAPALLGGGVEASDRVAVSGHLPDPPDARPMTITEPRPSSANAGEIDDAADEILDDLQAVLVDAEKQLKEAMKAHQSTQRAFTQPLPPTTTTSSQGSTSKLVRTIPAADERQKQKDDHDDEATAATPPASTMDPLLFSSASVDPLNELRSDPSERQAHRWDVSGAITAHDVLDLETEIAQKRQEYEEQRRAKQVCV